MCGASPAFRAASPPAAAIQPAWRPITSRMNTLVEVLRHRGARRSPPRAIDDRDVLRDRAEAGAAVGDRQVVVDGLRHVDRLDADSRSVLGELRHLEAGVGRVVAAVVEEVADVVRLEHLDQALVLRAVVLEPLQLVAAEPNAPPGVWRSAAIAAARLLAGVDQVFGQRADDAVAAGVDLADAVLVLARRSRSRRRREALMTAVTPPDWA